MYESMVIIICALAIILALYKINPNRFVYNLSRIVPNNVKKAFNNYSFKVFDSSGYYVIAILISITFLYSVWLSFINAVSVASLKVTTNADLNTLLNDLLKQILPVIGVFVIIVLSITIATIFFKKLNEHLWERGRTNRNIGLFTVKYLIETSTSLRGTASFIFFISMIAMLLLFPNSSGTLMLPQPLWVTTLYVVSGFGLIAICLISSQSILSLKKPHIQVTLRLLNWLKTYKWNTNNSMDYLLLPKIVQYCQEEITNAIGCNNINLIEYFELLYIARIWGTDKEKEKADDIIDSLSGSLKENKSRQFTEILCQTKEDLNELKKLNELRFSAKISFLKVKRPLSILSKINIVLVIIGTVAAIIAVLPLF